MPAAYLEHSRWRDKFRAILKAPPRPDGSRIVGDETIGPHLKLAFHQRELPCPQTA